MLAISAAVAVMLTACGGGSDGGAAGANGDNGANVTGNGDGTAPATSKPAANVRFSVDSATNIVTVELVDADGNVVPVSRDVTVEVPPGSGNTTTVALTDGRGQFTIPPSANGTDFAVSDPSSGDTFDGTVPGLRFLKDPSGNVIVELVGADGKPLPISGQGGVSSAITNANSVALNNGSGNVTVDVPNAGAVPFTLTDPNGNTVTGMVDTGSASYDYDNDPSTPDLLVLGCKKSVSPTKNFVLYIDGAIVDRTSQPVSPALTTGQTYTYAFTQEYKDSAGNVITGYVSRDVKIEIVSGQGEFDDGSKSKVAYMEKGELKGVQFKPTASADTSNPFTVVMYDTDCNNAGWDGAKNTTEFTVN